jgi:hypothetical protein
MRQIKFRICHQWGENKFVLYPCDTFMISLDGIVYENYGTKDEPMWESVFDADVLLQQYTGLQDKNGKDIYEGDILECFDGEKTEVRWSKAYSGWQWCEHKLGEDEPNDYYGGVSCTDYKTIVGNVFIGI